MENGFIRSETRGGSRQADVQREIRTSIKTHIKTLQVRESHYGRNNTCRQYLHPELSVSKLWRIWTQERRAVGLPLASRTTYSKVFHGSFNLAFGNPRVDICSFCTDLRNRINKDSKHEDKIALKLHRLRAKRFYSILRESKVDRSVLCVVFDMQQNLPLPKINITETYYSRQLWLYNLCFVIHDFGQSKRQVFFYNWLETSSGKGSNEVTSALAHFLKRIAKKAGQQEKLHLFSDSCPGQNKNAAMLNFLHTYANDPSNPFSEISFFFPIRGHSYLPADRVFGRAEKIFRKKEVIKTPEEYYAVLRTLGSVRELKNV